MTRSCPNCGSKVLVTNDNPGAIGRCSSCSELYVVLGDGRLGSMDARSLSGQSESSTKADPIRYRCAECRTELASVCSMEGKRDQCPVCGHMNTVSSSPIVMDSESPAVPPLSSELQLDGETSAQAPYSPPVELPDEIIVESADSYSKGSWLVTLAIVLFVGAIVGAGTGVTVWLYTSGGEERSADNNQPSTDRHSSAAPDWLGKSVGLLLVYRRLESPEGFIIDWIEGNGSCFAITEDGYLLTNRHITDAMQELQGSMGQTVHLFGTPMRVKGVSAMACFGSLRDQHFPCELVYADTSGQQDRDVAILQVGHTFNRPIDFAAEIRPGDRITVCGFPGDMMSAMRQAAKDKLLGRIRRGANRGRIRYSDMIPDSVWGKPASARGWISQIRGRNIEIDASMRHGNSGGPVLNQNWRVVGIATWGKDEAKYAIDLTPLKVRIDREIIRHRQMSDSRR